MTRKKERCGCIFMQSENASCIMHWHGRGSQPQPCFAPPYDGKPRPKTRYRHDFEVVPAQGLASMQYIFPNNLCTSHLSSDIATICIAIINTWVLEYLELKTALGPLSSRNGCSIALSAFLIISLLANFLSLTRLILLSNRATTIHPQSQYLDTPPLLATMSSTALANESALDASGGLHVHDRLEADTSDGSSPVRSPSLSGSKHYRTLQHDTKCIPWTLHRVHLGGLFIFLLSLIVALQIVYWHSVANQGLATATENAHYFWTYGPTAGM
jgi:hypothetical protein